MRKPVRQIALRRFELALILSALVACEAPNAAPTTPETTPADDLGSVSFQLGINGGNIQIGSIGYSIAGPGGFVRTGSLDVSHSATLSGIIDGLPIGVGYVLSLTASTASDVTHRLIDCHGSATFDVAAHANSPLMVHMICVEAPAPSAVPVAVPLSPLAMLALSASLLAAGVLSLRRRNRVG